MPRFTIPAPRLCCYSFNSSCIQDGMVVLKPFIHPLVDIQIIPSIAAVDFASQQQKSLFFLHLCRTFSGNSGGVHIFPWNALSSLSNTLGVLVLPENAVNSSFSSTMFLFGMLCILFSPSPLSSVDRQCFLRFLPFWSLTLIPCLYWSWFHISLC